MNNKEEEIKQLIDNCKIEGLKDLAIIMFSKDNVAVDVLIKNFKKQTKEVIEKQIPLWEQELINTELMYESGKQFQYLLTEENQNEVVEEMFTIKECAYLYYKLELSIEYYKSCIKLMKKILKNK
jgi:hypothetical protein